VPGLISSHSVVNSSSLGKLAVKNWRTATSLEPTGSSLRGITGAGSSAHHYGGGPLVRGPVGEALQAKSDGGGPCAEELAFGGVIPLSITTTSHCGAKKVLDTNVSLTGSPISRTFTSLLVATCREHMDSGTAGPCRRGTGRHRTPCRAKIQACAYDKGEMTH